MADVTSVLDKAGIDYDLLDHERTERALLEARALGVPPEQVAKTLVLSTPAGNVRAVLPASERVDFHKLRDLVEGGKNIRLLREDELERDYSEFELGAVPPFGGSKRDRVILDSRLAEQDSVVLEAGSHRKSVRLKTNDLKTLTGAEVADISQEA